MDDTDKRAVKIKAAFFIFSPELIMVIPEYHWKVIRSTKKYKKTVLKTHKFLWYNNKR